MELNEKLIIEIKKNSIYRLEENLRMVIICFEKITEKDYVIQEIYFNGQWPGRDGIFHTDDCDFTTLLYVSDYDPEWGGFTHFINSNNPKDHLAIPPITNRLVIFPSHIRHKAYSFCSQHCPMRISLTFKLDKK